MQGFNMGRYVPPDVEGTISGNALNNKHALGARASKLRTEGILTVRFEMPFGVWCSTCPKPTVIGQGVRFNAEKKKVGAYYSTPIWSFRMRHADCGGVIEIRTDPANAEYVVTEGGTRRDTGEDKDDSLVASSSGVLVGRIGGEILTEKEKDALRKDAFARLEKTIEDRAVLIERSHRIAELEDASHRAWEDPYAQNRRLRAAFRAGRKTREKEAESAEELKERLSLSIDLLPTTEEDARRAALVDFGVATALSGPETSEEGDGSNGIRATRDMALRKPLFSASTSSNNLKTSSGSSISKCTSITASKSNSKLVPKGDKGTKRLKSEIKASQTRESLASKIVGNTRASQDPFLVSVSRTESRGSRDNGSVGASSSGSRAPTRIQGIKRRRLDPDPDPPPENNTDTPTSTGTSDPGVGDDTEGERRKAKGEEGGDNENDITVLSSIPNTENTRNRNGLSTSTSSLDATPLNTTALVEYDSD
jgi:coiled-coil domain-containing protein 130